MLERLIVGDSGTDLVDKTNATMDAVEEVQELSALPAGTDPNGTELLFADQGGSAVKLTSEQLAGDAVAQPMGVARNVRRFFTNFMGSPKLRPRMSANGAIEHGAYFVQDGEGELGFDTLLDGNSGLQLTTHGSSPSGVTGVSGVVLGPPVYNIGSADIRFAVCAPRPWANAAGNTDMFFGLIPEPADGVPSHGVYFMGATLSGDVGTDSNYWRCVVDDGTTQDLHKTTVQIVEPALFNSPVTVLRIVKDVDAAETRFYIDGALVHTTPFATVGWPGYPITDIHYGGYIRKETIASLSKCIFAAAHIQDEQAIDFRNGDASLL